MATPTGPAADSAWPSGDHVAGQGVGVGMAVGCGAGVAVGGTAQRRPGPQVWRALHEEQGAPFFPQAASVVPTRQVVPSQQPEQLDAAQEAVPLTVQLRFRQIMPSQQLASPMHGAPDFAQPPSHRPPAHAPEQHWESATQRMRFGLQRQERLAQYFEQHAALVRHFLPSASPSHRADAPGAPFPAPFAPDSPLAPP